MQHIVLASVLYPTENLEKFLRDLLTSIKEQDYTDFSILFFLDGLEQTQISHTIKDFGIRQEIIFQKCRANTMTPSQIREKIIRFTHKISCDILIFCDFDEKNVSTRIKKTIQHMDKYTAFTFCNAYIADQDLNVLNKQTFFQNKKIPNTINSIEPILKKNFIGMGGLALQLKKIFLDDFEIPSDLLVFDWFLATYMLLQNCHGKKIEDCLVYYRQHTNNHIGINNALNIQKLHLGIRVKKTHYHFFSHFDTRFAKLLDEVNEIEQYTKKNEDKYIKIINENFNPATLCWWENIKTLEEIRQWI